MFPFRRTLFLLVTVLVASVDSRAEAVSFSPATSRVVFHARSTGHEFEGISTQVHGSFGCDRDRIAETARAEISIPVRSLRTGIDGRDKTMYESLLADRHPEIRFHLRRLTGLRMTGADSFSATAEGDLSIRGETRPVVIPITGRFRGADLEVSGSVPIRMTDYRIDPPGFLFFRVDPMVRVEFTVRGRVATARVAAAAR